MSKETVHIFPLSGAQRRIWFMEEADPGKATYNMAVGYRIKGAVHADVLERAAREVVRRHEALRTVFIVVDDEPVQAVRETVDLRVEWDDLSELSRPQAESEGLNLMTADARRPFDLEHGPLTRMRLIRVGDEDYYLSIVLHHIVSDGWSVNVLCRELSAIYNAFAGNEEPPLDDLPIQYADYAEWVNRRLHTTEVEEQLDYWKQKLAGLTGFELPTDHVRPAQQTYAGDKLEMTLSPRLAQDLSAIARQEGATVFMVLLAAFKVLIARYNRQSDIAVGSPVAGRTQQETEPLIGLFVNTLVLRTSLSLQKSFREVLADVRTTCLEALENQEVPFDHLVAAIDPPRDQSRSPLFQVFFAFENTPEGHLELGDSRIERMKGVGNASSKFDLSLYVRVDHDGLNAVLEYSTDLFDADQMERMLGHYRELLSSVVANPNSSVDKLAFVTDSELDSLRAWSRGNTVASPSVTVSDLIEEVSRTHAGKTAVVFDEIAVTYRELEEASSRLANYLKANRVGPGVLVGVVMDRSDRMVTSLLAVLKAGGAYVPIDPDYPRDRIAFILENTDLPIILTEERHVDGLPETDAKVVCVDRDAEMIAAYSSEAPERTATVDDLAYVIYTSGSTGRPKGVQVSHRALTNFVRSMQKRPGFSSRDVLLSVTTISFDIAALELFVPLVSGGTVVVAARGDVVDGRRIAGVLESHDVTVMQATPATWHMLLESGWKGRHSLRMLCGGEALPVDLAQRLLPLGGELWNMYGPTETTIWSLISPVRRGDPITIGRPISNTTIYILDENLEMVPVGVPGELYIGGEGLANGYLNRPDLTAEKFITNPHDAQVSPRIYRTGDSVRWRADGNVEHLGRLDTQVKVRGFRIELGEIESVLRQAPGVVDAIAQPWDDHMDKLIAAYYTTSDDVSVSSLREHLRGFLPEYMVPSSFVRLDELPLTPNGKVDRKALPPPEPNREALVAEFVAPSTDLEVVLARIWGEVLSVDNVGVHDNFVDLGGHSLLATQVSRRVEKALGVRLPPMQILFQTVRQMSAEYEKKTDGTDGERAPSVADNNTQSRLAGALRRIRNLAINGSNSRKID